MTTGRINQVANVCTQDRGAAQGTQSRPTPHNPAHHRTHTELTSFWLLISQTVCGQQDQHTHWETAHKRKTPSVCTARIRKADIKKFIHILSINMYCLSGSVYTSKGVCGKTSESNLTKFTHRTVQTHKAIRSRCRNTQMRDSHLILALLVWTVGGKTLSSQY